MIDLQSPSDHASLSTLVDLLRRRIGEPDEIGYRFLAGREGGVTSLTFAELDRRARAVAVSLTALHGRGERALLCYPPGLEFLIGFFGSLYAGMVAVPAYPPRAHKPDARLASIAVNCRPSVVLTTADLVAERERLVAKMPDLERIAWLASDAVEDGRADDWRPVHPSPDDLAVLQYTSGSTGDPKGVMLTHRCVLHNLAGISRAMELHRGTIGVCWLPAFHDMGLIGHLLGIVWFPGTLHVLSPLAMLQEPFRWLDAVSKTQAVISGGPCFAYEQCLKRITVEQRKQLDLSAWRVAFVGAEPISARVMDAFANTFAECGFRRESIYPCFGLAESSLMVTGVDAGRGPMVRTFRGDALEQDRAELAEKGRVLVGSGSPARDMEVRIVEPVTGQPIANGSIGEVWVHGPSVAAGYFNRPEATEATFGALLDGKRWLRTGDLGFFHEDELFIAGRLKDLLILRGRNFYPQDLEEAVQVAVPMLKASGGAAFTRDEDDGARLVLVYEVSRSYKPGESDVFASARAVIAEEFGIELSELVLIRASTLPRTSSGKVARRESEQRYLAGQLEVVERFEAPTEVRAATVSERHGTSDVRAWLIERLARQLQVKPSRIDPERPFAGYGLDSLAMVRIASDLERWLGKPLSPTTLYSAPTIASLARALGEPNGASALTVPPLTEVANGIAIVGIGCRFPGADSREEFWQFLREGRNAIRDLPEGRWRHNGLALTTTRGGYLDPVRGFDAPFFSLSPREAAWIDPQHRLLLETAYHALEDAGLAVDRLAGSAVGVFVGISSNDYGKLVAEHAGPEMYLATGNATSMAAHRLSYHLDLRGPSLAIDTACSSSLTAVHYACRSLRDGECDLALAAGVNLILTPEITEALSRAQMLSPSARCKTFDASADGYVRGEGVGVVVLKSLALARRDGDPIYAVIEGTAINQDGRSNGITAPNGAAQTALLRHALARAGRTAADVGCIETHGTGTSLGDPIEFDALSEALGETPAPCMLGAVKANIGHLEAAAGIAGLIKSALQLHHGEIVPLVGLQEVNPLIRLESSRFRLPRTLTPWPRGDKPRVMGVSSFGFGGSNAHVLLAEAPLPPPLVVSRAPKNFLIPLSARTEPALRDVAANLAVWLRTHDLPLPDLAHTLSQGRTHLPLRLVVQASDPADLVAALETWSRSGRDSRVQTGKAFADLTGHVAFLFTGQGSAFAGMARSLSDYEVFRTTLDRCDKVNRRLTGWSVREALYDVSRGEETEFGQPVLFAFQVALAALWQSWGVEPAAVLGHSVGECAAACVSGMLSLEDALKLVVTRGRRMQACPPGAMLACLASAEQVSPTLERYRDRITLAADNGPGQCVLAGDPGAIAAVAMELTESRIDSRPLKVRRAFHSPLIEPALAEIRDVASSLKHHPPRIALVSNVTGKVVQELPTGDYWAEHARATVQFAAGLRTLREVGITHFVEIGPAAVLSRLGPTCLTGAEATWLASMTDADADPLRALARLHTDGAKIDWGRLQVAGQRVRLPGYPFQHRDYWVDDLPRVTRQLAPTAATTPTSWRPRSCWAQQLPRESPAFGSLADTVTGCVDAAWEEQSLAGAVELRDRFDRLAGNYIVATFAQLGWRPVAGETTSLEALAERLGVASQKTRLLRRLTQLAAEDGWLALKDEMVQVQSAPLGDDPARAHADLLKCFPDFDVELRLAHHCAGHLADVLRGTVDPLQVLFDGQAGRWTSEIYSRAPVARFYNALLTRTVARLVESLPADRPLRVLELGAGTGGTTQALVPVLPKGRTEYVFSDVSSLFLARARDQFAAHDAIVYHMLDLEKAPFEQGFAAGQFDLVVASNVLHATADLRQSVRHARELLTPGGMLVLLEGTGPRRLLDLIFGLTEGWWRFRDDSVRPDYPLIAPDAWRKLLAEEGFEECVVLPEGDARLPDPDQVVIQARSASKGVFHPKTPAARGSWLLVGDDGPLAASLAARLTEAGATVVGHVNGSTPQHTVLLPGAVHLALPTTLQQPWRVTLGEWPAAEEDVRHIDLDPAYSVPTQAIVLTEALLHPDSEAVVVYRRDQRYVTSSSVVEVKPEAPPTPDVAAPDRGNLLAASPFERRALVESYLRQELNRLLGATISDDDMEMPVQSLGLDSLMAIQVRNRVETSLGVALSLVDFLKGLRVRQLVDSIDDQLAVVAVAPVESPSSEAPAPVPSEQVGSLSETELDSLLVSLLDTPRNVR